MAAKETRLVTRLSSADDDWLAQQAEALREHGIDVGKAGVVRMLVACGRRNEIPVLSLIEAKSVRPLFASRVYRGEVPPLYEGNPSYVPGLYVAPPTDDDGLDYGSMSNDELDAIARQKANEAEAAGVVVPRQPVGPQGETNGSIRPLAVVDRKPGKDWAAV